MKLSNTYNLAIVNPTLAQEWHPSRNGKLTPRDITPGSDRKIWWRCKKGHDWKATMYSRNSGNGCPGCSGRMATEDNCLAAVRPDLAKEWHPTRNGKLTLMFVTPFSNRKVWWQCKNNKNHVWQAVIKNRNEGKGCPYCSGRRATEINCLLTVRPDLAKEWHPTRNGKLTPRDATPNSNKKIWWQCKKGHVWKTRIADRSQNHGCPYCSRQKVCKDNCLQTINPVLAREWHPTKNGKLTPWDVTPNSNKKIWWKCKKGHEWETTINSRSQNHGCPYCSGLKACKDNCLQTVRPDLAKEWHPTLNSNLTPRDVTHSSGKKVWWLCNREHEWKAIIASRSAGRNCPYCWNMLQKGLLKGRSKP